MANKLVIEIRHAAAAKAATGGNTDSVATPPHAPANVDKHVPAPSTSPKHQSNENKTAPEPTPAFAKEPISPWRKAQSEAMKQMHAHLKGK